MRARLAVRISPADVGRRVSVRARYRGPDASAVDVVGHLVWWRDGVLIITRSNGEQRTVNERDLLAGKVITAGQPPKVRPKARGST